MEKTGVVIEGSIKEIDQKQLWIMVRVVLRARYRRAKLNVDRKAKWTITRELKALDRTAPGDMVTVANIGRRQGMHITLPEWMTRRPCGW